MNQLSENTRPTVVSHLHAITKNLFGLLAAGAILGTVSCTGPDQTTVELAVDPVLGQAVFALPEDAANAFILALANDDAEMLGKVLGADYREVLPLDEVDGEDVDNFITAWEKFNTLLPQGENKMLIAVGEDEWTLPIPVVKGTSGWYFDVEEGLERMRIRRIGRNELATMQAVLAYYDAQMEYPCRPCWPTMTHRWNMRNRTVMVTACWNMHSNSSVHREPMMACSGKSRPVKHPVHSGR